MGRHDSNYHRRDQRSSSRHHQRNFHLDQRQPSRDSINDNVLSEQSSSFLTPQQAPPPPIPIFSNLQQQQYALQNNLTSSPFCSNVNSIFYTAGSHMSQISMGPQTCSEQLPSWPVPSEVALPSIPVAALGLQIPAEQITETGIIPNNPYYELPSGVMVPLIEAGKKDYSPIKPADLRLPLPKFPDDNFLRAIETYYTDDSTMRDNDGWSKDFIDKMISSTVNC